MLKEIYQEMYSSLSEGCKIYFETFEVSIEASQSVYLSNDDKIFFDKNYPTVYDGTITYIFRLLDNFEIKVPLQAMVCGLEKIVPRSGVSLIEFELSKDDQSLQYFTDFKINQLLESSSKECHIDETTFEIV